ncbi:MAG TPA: acyl-ACP desaturase [Terriglobia bacterium]|nr:acyl-ACP desaturase [Terriglobia bacterium]
MDNFDLEKYLNNSKKVDLSEFDFSTAAAYSLTDDEVRCLHYMMDVESSTIVYLRSILRTCVIDDPEAVAFLSCWAYEEYFHGRLIREFLRVSGVEVSPERYVQVKRSASLRERVEELGASFMCGLTRHFHAAYLTWGAVQELTTLEGYGVLARRTSNPLLRTVLNRIIKDERRHFSFYFNKARTALEASRAQRLTTFLLRRFWTPVGSGVKADPEVNWMIRFVFGGPGGAEVTRRIDSTLARLPGLSWFDLMSGARLSLS